MTNGISSKWISINSYDVFRVVLGLLILGIVLFVYLKYYYTFEGKATLGSILTIMLIVGIILLINGMDAWKIKDKEIQKGEKMRRKVEYLKNKKELEEIKNK